MDGLKNIPAMPLEQNYTLPARQQAVKKAEAPEVRKPEEPLIRKVSAPVIRKAEAPEVYDSSKNAVVTAGSLSEKDADLSVGAKVPEKEKDGKDTEKPVVPEKKKSMVFGTDAKYAYDKNINRITITITDSENNQVVREIPPEATRKALAGLQTLQGNFVDQGI